MQVQSRLCDLQDGLQEIVELAAALVDEDICVDVPSEGLRRVEERVLVHERHVAESDVVECRAFELRQDARELEVAYHDGLVVHRRARSGRIDVRRKRAVPAVELGLNGLETEQVDLALKRETRRRRLRRGEDRIRNSRLLSSDCRRACDCCLRDSSETEEHRGRRDLLYHRRLFGPVGTNHERG